MQNIYYSHMMVNEYMAAGMPVVASRIGQLEKLIEPDVNGLLVPPGDAPALAAALDRLQADPKLRTRLGRMGRMMVLSQYTWDRVVQEILRISRLELPSRPCKVKPALVEVDL